MPFSIQSVVLDGLNSQSALVHATSPRYFETSEGQKRPLNFGRNEDGRISPEHQRLFFRSLNIGSDQAFMVQQTHSDRVHVMKDPAQSSEALSSVKADAVLTHLVDRPIAVLTADCLPVVLYDPRNHVAGVVHAGRQGTAGRILSKAVTALKKEYGTQGEDLLAGMGPGIGGCCYEVDEECIRPFQKKYAGWKSFAMKGNEGKYMLDLCQANEQDALSAGILPGNIFRSGQCTSCEKGRFFSYRREGTSGRMMTVAMLRPDKNSGS
ncbi:MAG: peptidoglycan editing factor PgeF [Nitrospinaceae bacterium]